MSVAEGFAYCERMAHAHYENFPVGSLLIPKSKRRHFYSIYAFARTADDFADEEYERGLSESDRLAALDDWGEQLERCEQGRASSPVFVALASTIRELDLPLQLFRDLISAFKQDVTKRRYRSYEEVLDYCARSANPVGRLILLLFGYRDQRLHTLSDNICTGLQLANHWQDVAVDLEKDRIYLPEEDLARFGLSETDLFDHRCNEPYRRLVKYQVDRTRELFERGAGLPEQVRGRLALELRLIWHGGMRILERIEMDDYDTLNSRPRISALDKLLILSRGLTALPVSRTGGNSSEVERGQ